MPRLQDDIWPNLIYISDLWLRNVKTLFNSKGRHILLTRHYNSTEIPVGPVILPRLLTRSVMLQGFIVRNYSDHFDEGLNQLGKWVKERKLKYTETIIKGFDNLPYAFLGLFSGKNTGKMIVEID